MSTRIRWRKTRPKPRLPGLPVIRNNLGNDLDRNACTSGGGNNCSVIITTKPSPPDSPSRHPYSPDTIGEIGSVCN